VHKEFDQLKCLMKRLNKLCVEVIQRRCQAFAVFRLINVFVEDKERDKFGVVMTLVISTFKIISIEF
jgi:hypothetical protein